MTLQELYETLKIHFGQQANPDAWWPIYYGRSVPPEFERAITNILVQNSSWRAVQRAVELLNQADLLTANAIAEVPAESIASCIKPTGLKTIKTQRLKALCTFVIQHFRSEGEFCTNVTREELLQIHSIGEETADRILLYTCARLAWPVDTYCLRVLGHYKVIPAIPVAQAERKRAAGAVKQMVAQQIPHQLDDWQRLHALMQLSGSSS